MSTPAPLSPVDVEERIRQLASEIARGVNICNGAYLRFLEADREFDFAYALEVDKYKGPQWKAKYAADMQTMELREARDVADAAYRYADRRAKALERELDAMRSVGASIRAAYSVAGRGEG